MILATNIVTKKPIPVAFVEFSLPEAAKRAILAQESLFMGCFVKITQARTSAVADFIKKREYSAKGFDKLNKLAWNPLI